ncbi:protein quaking-B-like isoform X2 [Watersipora subatra]|uniref:protein quaking-B-like isoform X2 n=1 Tax=Watersipora subatra TaxID=2589382 RepID=UPI00355B71B8
MGTETTTNEDKSGADYLSQLLKDKKQLQAFPNVFIHLDRLLDDEINKVRVTLFNLEKKPLALPDEDGGPKVSLTEKLYVPVKEHPDFNFVGRILGPRGITAKQLEKDTGCKIMVRGKGSMRDKKKEEQMKGKPNWEHLSEELHVLVVVEDSQHRAEVKMQRAVDEIKRLLIPAPEGEDDLKRRQLMELAIINGTYRDTKSGSNTQTNGASPPTSLSPLGGAPSHPAAIAAAVASQMQHRLMGQPLIPTNPAYQQQINMAMQQQQLRAQVGQLGGQILLSPRLPTPVSQHQTAALLGMPPPPMVSSTDAVAGAGAVLYNTGSTTSLPGFMTAGQATPDLSAFGTVLQNQQAAAMYDYSNMDPSAAGSVPKMRRPAVATHPYQRV